MAYLSGVQSEFWHAGRLCVIIVYALGVDFLSEEAEFYLMSEVLYAGVLALMNYAMN